MSGSSTLPSSMLRAFAAGPPFPAMKAVAGEKAGEPHRRLSRAGRRAVRPKAGSDSSQGRAMVTPTPRRKARREKEWTEGVIFATLSQQVRFDLSPILPAHGLIRQQLILVKNVHPLMDPCWPSLLRREPESWRPVRRYDPGEPAEVGEQGWSLGFGRRSERPTWFSGQSRNSDFLVFLALSGRIDILSETHFEDKRGRSPRT